ncbi:MAG: hypothetical protein HY731_15125 [Candidatus Tectomicrobia bacterium]|nr:hypothetical protein [Candidatus Tectomicrobia bacterium]
MSQILTLELPAEVYEAVKQEAEAMGKTPAEWIISDLCQRLSDRGKALLRQKVHPEIYQILQQIAPKMGKSTEELIIEWKAQYGAKPRPQLTDEEWEAARQRLMRHAGAVDSGDPNSADNERIDEDLAREYGSTHEEEA